VLLYFFSRTPKSMWPHLRLSLDMIQFLSSIARSRRPTHYGLSFASSTKKTPPTSISIAQKHLANGDDLALRRLRKPTLGQLMYRHAMPANFRPPQSSTTIPNVLRPLDLNIISSFHQAPPRVRRHS
jgi:hypothetical protein